MKIAIIGAGFAGLNIAWELKKIDPDNHLEIEVLEKDSRVAGMTAGYKLAHWQWSLEDHYHHIFEGDSAVASLAKDLGCKDKLFYKKVETRTLYNGQFYRLDSALALLRFSEIPFFDRLRTGVVLAFLKMIPNGKCLEKYSAAKFLKKTMGKKSWQVIWEPLFRSKFADSANEINLAWFWARVKPRTPKLGYFEGGWQKLADIAKEKLEAKGVKFFLNTQVKKIKHQDHIFKLSCYDLKKKRSGQRQHDLVISTLPSTIFSQIINLPELKENKLGGLAAMTLMLRLKDGVLPAKTYWLNINEKNWPFVAAVEHSNYIDSQYYGDEKILYLGRYLPSSDKNYQLNKKQVFKQYLPYLKKLDKKIEDKIIDYELFKNDFGQPVTRVNHSQILPTLKTSIPNLYWCSMQHVYPFDRGINNALVESKKLLKLISQENRL